MKEMRVIFQAVEDDDSVSIECIFITSKLELQMVRDTKEIVNRLKQVTENFIETMKDHKRF